MQLNENFLFELFNLGFQKKDVFEKISEHLKFQYLPEEAFKKIFKYTQDYYSLNKTLPSIGIISQQFLTDKDSKSINHILTKIKDSQVIGKNEALSQFQEFVKDAWSTKFYEDFADLFNEGKKEKARELLRQTGEAIANFSIYKNDSFERVFADFNKRHHERIMNCGVNQLIREKVPFSIDELDDITYGGIDRTETACVLARSGVGKTKFIRWVSVGAARRKHKVLHIQAEGSKQKCLEGYDVTWSAVLMSDLKEGNINSKTYQKLQSIINEISVYKSDVYVHAFEQFNSGTMVDVRNLVIEFIKNYGEIGLISMDYLEKMEPGDGRRYAVSEEKERREKIADLFKNIVVEFETRGLTATQANDIPPTIWNDPTQVMTRHNVSMAKGLVNSFSYFLTLNQTSDEYKAHIMRIYCDKLRDYESGQIVKIAQNYKHDRFYDRMKTISEFYSEEE